MKKNKVAPVEPYLTPGASLPVVRELCEQLAYWDDGESTWVILHPVDDVVTVSASKRLNGIEAACQIHTFMGQNGLTYNNVCFSADNSLSIVGIAEKLAAA